MNDEEKKVIAALNTLIEYCDKQEGCCECVLSVKNVFGYATDCCINSLRPYQWDTDNIAQ